MKEVMKKQSLFRALERIGQYNGHAPPIGDNHDPVLHELLICNVARTYFNARRQAAIDNLHMHLQDVVGRDAITECEGKVGTHEAFTSTNYLLLVEVRSPSERIDKTRVATELQKLKSSDLPMSASDAQQFISRCSRQTKAPTQLTVVRRMP